MLSTIAKNVRGLRFTGISRSLSALNFVEEPSVLNVTNEPVLGHAQGSPERALLEKAISKWKDTTVEVPIVIGGVEYSTNEIRTHTAPFDHSIKVAKFSYADEKLITKAIENSLSVREEWEKVPTKEKIAIFMKAADLVGSKYRYDLLAQTMIGQGKTIFQAEIDAAAELADFLRFNAMFRNELLRYSPLSPEPSKILNQYRYRGLEGFFTAISPFNFTAIGGNLAAAPALMGNVVLWKPSDAAILSSYTVYKILIEAGIPAGVINFVPSEGPLFGRVTTKHPSLSGINFTGSLATFRNIWKDVASNIDGYKDFPRLSGECGGKNFHFVHETADIETVVAQTILSAFEFSGQKCSACERLYVPKNLWPKVQKGLVDTLEKFKVGSPLDFSTYTSAVIDGIAFKKISGFLEYARQNHVIIAGGEAKSDKGWFIDPTIVRVEDIDDRLLKEEIFGPVLSVFVYDPKNTDEIMEKALHGTPYGLTASIFGQDQNWLTKAAEKLKHAGGNFYVNDKSTGAVVGQQPFGGSRASGTNDKPGGPHYLLRFTTPQTIKQSLVNLRTIQYSYMS